VDWSGDGLDEPLQNQLRRLRNVASPFTVRGKDTLKMDKRAFRSLFGEVYI
jgi:hypothetical protein